jgi:hypothetical protein
MVYLHPLIQEIIMSEGFVTRKLSNEQFDIPRNTRLTVRHKGVDSKLYEECRITRGGDDTLEVRYRDFHGCFFNFLIDINSREASTFAPWEADSNNPTAWITSIIDNALSVLAWKRSTTRNTTTRKQTDYLVSK